MTEERENTKYSRVGHNNGNATDNTAAILSGMDSYKF
jgi:hypothetical protein